MRIVAVKLLRGKSQLEVVAADADGNLYRTTLRWFAKGQSELPPEGWESTVLAEFQRSKNAAPTPPSLRDALRKKR